MEGSVKMEPAGAELSSDPYQINPEPKMFVDTIPCKRTLHIIELRKYHKQLKMLYQDLLKQREQNSIEEANKNLPSIPSMPETPELPQARTQMIPKSLSETMMYNLIRQNQGNDSPSSSNINQSYFEKSDFAQGIGEPPISISHPVAMHTLRKAVASMLLLSGFDSATAPVLDHLTDAADGYMRKLCKSLNYNVFLKSYPEYTPEFPDALECTLQEEGIGSMSVIQKFYKVRVIQHHENMLSKCRNLRHECEMLRNSKIKATELPIGGTEAKVTEPLSNVVDEDNEPQPGPSASVSHGDEYKKGLFAQREIGSWPKDIMGSMLETGLLSNVDFSKDANIQGTAVHSVTSALEISQPMTDLLISGTNSPSSSVGSSRPAKVSRRKKKGRKGR